MCLNVKTAFPDNGSELLNTLHPLKLPLAERFVPARVLVPDCSDL